MVKLTDLGIFKDAIFEAIISTYDKNQISNAAPMGIIMQDQQTITLNIFNSSQTNQNLKTNKHAVINLTKDIELFYRTALKETNSNAKLPQEWFEKAQMINAPKLKSADAAIEVSIKSMLPAGTEKTKFTCNIEVVKASKNYSQAYCRAMSAALEAIIHATRVKAFIHDEKQKKQTVHLLELIKNCSEVVNRTAPNSRYSMVMADLMQQINSWRSKS